MTLKQVLAITATSVGFSLFAPHAQAALITGVTASTDMGTRNSTVDLNSTVNGVGLPGDTPALTGTHAVFSGSPPNTWLSANGTTTGNITFDLGGSFDLAGFSFWNYHQAGGATAGIEDVTVQSSTDGINFTTITGAPTVFSIGNNGGTEDPELFSFTPVTTSFVRFVVGSNYGLSFATGFAEVQFDGTPAAPQTTPEPSLLLGLLAFGTVGAVSRKRKK
ncbi:MAG: discoidin domain-containing protein [Microcystaceae cyanobacterium]